MDHILLKQTVKSAAKVIKESLLEADQNLDDISCDAQDFKQSWGQTKVPGVLITLFSVLMN